MSNNVEGKLYKLTNLFKALKLSLQPPKPKLPSLPKPSLAPKAPKASKISSGIAPKTKKDPMKVAQQFAMIKEESGPGDTYHLHIDGHQITDKPMSLKDIHQVHGPVPKLEASGVRIVKHQPKKV